MSAMIEAHPHRNMTAHGFVWVYDDDGAHFYQREVKRPDGLPGYHLMRLLPSDLTNKNFEFMAKHGLTNTNKAKKR